MAAVKVVRHFDFVLKRGFFKPFFVFDTMNKNRHIPHCSKPYVVRVFRTVGVSPMAHNGCICARFNGANMPLD